MRVPYSNRDQRSRPSSSVPSQKLARCRGADEIAKLHGVRRRRKDICQKSDCEDRRQNAERDIAGAFHRRSRWHTAIARSDAEFVSCVTAATRIVRLTSTGRSRASAAFHASWPMPGKSHSTSIGMAAPKATPSETPARASNCGAVHGATCQKKIAGFAQTSGARRQHVRLRVGICQQIARIAEYLWKNEQSDGQAHRAIGEEQKQRKTRQWARKGKSR